MRSPVQVQDAALHHRAFAIGLVLSVAIHAALLVGVRFGKADEGEDGAGRGHRALVSTVAMMRAYDLIINDGLAAENQEAKISTRARSSRTPELPSNDTRTRDPMEGVPSNPLGAPTVKDRILPRSSDPRLWMPSNRLSEGVAKPVGEVRARIEELVDHSNDSIAAAAENEKRITDWTHVGPEGRRWGTTPGRFYLGSLVIPYCGGDYSAINCGVGVPLGRVADYEARARAFTEIGEQRTRAKIDEILEERIRAVRSRAAARRDSVRGTRLNRVP